MKKWIKASTNTNRLPITELTEDEIIALPERVTVVTRTPGIRSYVPVFEVVSKDALLDPGNCLFIDSYWGYAHGRDIYLASESEVEKYYQQEIQKLQGARDNYRRYAL